MMFREELAVAIVTGRKTQTSRVLSDNPRSPWYRNRKAGDRYPVGSTFTINPGRGVQCVAEAKVEARFRSTIGTVIYHDFAAEGFVSAEEFKKVWATIHPRFDAREVVDVVRFKLVGRDCPECDGCGWCEGSPAWTCKACGGNGIERSPRAVALIEKVEHG